MSAERHPSREDPGEVVEGGGPVANGHGLELPRSRGSGAFMVIVDQSQLLEVKHSFSHCVEHAGGQPAEAGTAVRLALETLEPVIAG